jgi:PAS domain S-box-containing protein
MNDTRKTKTQLIEELTGLRSERNFSESLIETAQVIVLVLDPEGRIVRFNPYMEDISGYRLEEVQGKDWFTTFLPERDQARIRDLFLSAIGDIQTRGNVNPILTRDGHECLIEWYDKTLKDAEGRNAGLLSIGQDITKRRQAEEALAREEAELRATLYGIGDAVISTDIEGRVARMNPQAEQLTGWTEVDAVGRLLDEVFHIVNEETHQKVESPVTHVLREGDVVGLANHTLLVSKDGREIPIADSGAPIQNEKGGTIGVVLVFRDQSEERLGHQLTEMRLALIAHAVDHDLDEFLTWSLDEVGILVGSPIGFYHFVEPDQKSLSLQQWSTRTLKEFCRAEGKGLHYDIDQAGVWGDCVNEKKPVIHNDYAALPHKKGMPEGHAEEIRELVVPVVREDKVVAILGVGNKSAEYTQRDVEIVSYLADVTWEIVQKKRADETLKQSEGILNATGKMGKIGGWEHDLGTGKAVWTQALYDIIEIPYDREPPGVDEHLDYYPLRDQNILREAYQQAIDSGVPFDLELQVYTAKKKMIWCRAQGEPVYEGGKCVTVRGIFQDVTERKQAEEVAEVNLALQRVRNEILLMEEEEDWGNVVQRLERELRSLIDFEDCGINVLDEKNDVQIDYYMKLDELQCEKVMGIPSVLRRVQEMGEPLYRRNRREIDQWENNRSRPEIRSVVDIPFPGGTLAINSKEESAFDERDIQIFSQFAQVVAEGTRRLEDITQRKQMEQELVRLERLRAVGELSAGVSHNLNNILTNVLGPAQLLQRKTDDPELLREVDDIITSAVRARDLVHELHLSVRTEEEETLKPVSVDPVVQQAVQTARPRWKDEAEAKGVTIEVVTQWGGTPPIKGTEGGLHDIFTNLIFNAVDAMPEGGGIHIQTARMNDRVEITLSDTGTGMDEATRLRVFEPFFTTKMDIGTGLGLSTVFNTVTRWEGTIKVDSNPGEGTMFTLHFPIWADEVVEEEGRETVVQPVRGGKVLIVDDDESICRLLSRLLEERHEVEAVGDGRQALDMFAPGKYDAVMIDLGMSGISGDQLVKRMQEIDPLAATVLITGWALPEADVRVMSFDFRIEKPFDDLDEVEDVVARAIAVHDRRAARE